MLKREQDEQVLSLHIFDSRIPWDRTRVNKFAKLFLLLVLKVKFHKEALIGSCYLIDFGAQKTKSRAAIGWAPELPLDL